MLVNALFFGVSFSLVVVAAYWLAGRRAGHSAGSLATGSLLAFCSLAFLSYPPGRSAD
ncbi:hypothetical protein [Streptomyces sp. NRRL F-5123]|uniref:hypothetical protein n=1 Tax=Streptomyces sp. NRRL F-5123 TaxID=1463856 RepID=UPI001902A012|nr:hypothetical protein [Streptomyces sp. NRRL F-5123]